MDEVIGTIFGRWYVTGFGVAFAVLAVRHMGIRKTLVFAAGALTVGIASENTSVNWGIPYTHYEFNPELRGDEIWVWDVPLMISLSYTFMAYFAFAAGRVIVSGPYRTRGPIAWEYAVGTLISLWAVWIMDPVSQLGEHYFLGELFGYDGPGFWFDIPLGSQVGFFFMSAITVGLATYLCRNDPDEPVEKPLLHPHLPALGGYMGQITFMFGAAMWAGRSVPEGHALAGAAVLIYFPWAVMVALHWRTSREVSLASR